MKIVSVRQMRNLDFRTISEGGIPGRDLMFRAGFGAGDRILEFVSKIDSRHIKRFIFLAGKGNNGGDAYVAAKYLYEKTSCEIVIYSVCKIEDLQGDAKYYAEELPEGICFYEKRTLKEKHFRKGDIIIDGLLGTGFKGELKEPYYSWIKLINRLHLPVIALDIPSGLNGDTGEISSVALQSDLTITMGMPKKGLVVGEGPICCGRIKIVDIGIPAEYLRETVSNMSMFTGYDAYRLLDRLFIESHKKSFGSILVIGGSKLYTGAPLLTGKSALRTGAGVVIVAVPKSAGICVCNMNAIITRQIEDDGKGFFNKASIPELKELAGKADVIVVGPGMGNQNSCVEMLKDILETDKPLVVDADALNLISENPGLLPSCRENMIFTPHPGEAKRLFNGHGFDFEELKSRKERAETLGKILRGTLIYKGHRTITVSGNNLLCINGSGGPALATAGSGDVLSGIIAANLGAGMNCYDAACLGVYLHGIAGEIGDKGARGLTADDIVELIPNAIKRSSPFA